MAVTAREGTAHREAYELPAAEVMRMLDTDARTGLTAGQVRERLAGHGPNTLPAIARAGPLARLARQFHNPLVYVLLAAAAITLLLGDHVDAIVIVAVVMVNALVGYLQEARAENALAALAAITETTATVVRDGTRTKVASAEVVPGELVLVEAGDKVPADLRLIEAPEMSVDESALTGESTVVAKDPVAPGATAHDTADGAGVRVTVLAERHTMAYAGTLVTAGRGTGVAVATGAGTEIGLVHRLVDAATATPTPLTRKIAYFTRLVTVAILALAVLTFTIGLIRGEPVAEMLTAAVALAVGAIPEGLPAVVTITLAYGVARMVRHGAIIRRLPAVETLGSTTIICTDKTGTLTENQMTVTAVVAGGEEYEVTGSGYAPYGEIVRLDAGGDAAGASAGAAVRSDRNASCDGGEAALEECLRAGLACNDARLVQRDGNWEVIGDPTEAALRASAAKAGVGPAPPRVDTVPFASERQYMATLHRPASAGSAAPTSASPPDGGPGTVYVKGAVERTLDRCVAQLTADGREEPLDAGAILAAAHRLGKGGLRTLAFARATVGPDVRVFADLPATGPDAAGFALPELVFLGLQAMHDPPRPDAVEAVRACRRAGIQVKMITGDHAATALAVAGQMGLDASVLPGPELADCSDTELPETAERVAVFARVSPEQKLRLVRALQHRAHVIAMTGDGVNDAPALKQADIGVAMGRGGTEVAKESADIVLTDDNFASIKAAVEEGRRVFDNLVKFIVWALPANVGLGLVLVAAIVTGTTLPVEPVQVLWLNMAAVLVLGLPFTAEPAEPDIMRRPPRPPGDRLLGAALVGRILLISAVLVAGAFGLFHGELAAGASPAAARTVVVNVFALTLLATMFNCLSLDRPPRWTTLAGNQWAGGAALALLAMQLLYTYLPPMNELFRSAPIPAAAWGHVAAVAAAAFLIVESAKWAQRRIAHSRSRA